MDRMRDRSTLLTEPTGAERREEPFLLSNAMLLSGRELIGLGIFAAALVIFMPALWKEIEPLDRESDYRIPYELGNDYWLFARCAEDATARFDTLILGDSVVWGQYVKRDETLSHFLNERAGSQQFANLGVDGMHPAALAGLIEHHGAAIHGKNVILHANLLWLSSPRPDLTGEEAFHLNHPGLVPQFFPRIPSYREEVSKRIGLVVERNLEFLQWNSHLQAAYFDQKSIPEWTLEHPYEFPVRVIERKLPPSDNRLRNRPVPWTEQGIRKQDFDWVDLERSFQWRSLQRAIELLRQRGNRVFVIIGPFNEHLLTETGAPAYVKLRDAVAAWLADQRIDHLAPPALPSELYGDASHPLAEGYRQLAEQVFAKLPWK
jgi:hypothetical protein